MRVEHKITIHAPASRVWTLTIDVERWPTITPTTITSVDRLDDGQLDVGGRARIKQPWQRPTIWTVREFEPERRFVWEARSFGLHMVATHEIETVAEGCTNSLTLDVTGGGTLFARLLRGRMAKTLEIENECFKRIAEQESSPAF